MIEGELVPVDSESDELKQDIEDVINRVHTGNAMFVQNFARLGTLLSTVRTKKVWADWGFESFGSYIKDVEAKIKRGRSQIYNSISVSERLLPFVSEIQLENIGITKATELSKMVKLTGKPPSAGAITLAENPLIQADELKAHLHEEYHVLKSDDKGTYMDLRGFFVTPEERAEIEFVFDIVAKVDPPIPPETSDWERRKQVIMRLIQEFRSAGYEKEVLGELS